MSIQCWYCGCSLEEWPRGVSYGADVKKCKVKEHQTPRSRGGKQTVSACVSCNSRKGTKTLEEYRSYLRAKVATMKAANALREALPSLDEGFAKEVGKVAEVLEWLTPKIIFFGEKGA